MLVPVYHVWKNLMLPALHIRGRACVVALTVTASLVLGCTPDPSKAVGITGPDLSLPRLEQRPADELLPQIDNFWGSYTLNEVVGQPVNYRLNWIGRGKKMNTLMHLIVEHPDLPGGGTLNKHDQGEKSMQHVFYVHPDSLDGSFVIALPLSRCDYRTGAFIHAQASTSWFGDFGQFGIGAGGPGGVQLSYTPPAINALSMVSEPWTVPIESTGGTCPAPLPPSFTAYTPNSMLSAPASDTIVVADGSTGIFVSAIRTGSPPSSIETDIFYVDGTEVGTEGGFGMTIYGLGVHTVRLERTNIQGVTAAREITLIFDDSPCVGSGGGGVPDQPSSMSPMYSTTSCTPSGGSGGGGDGGIDCSVTGDCTICFDIDWYWVYPDGTEVYSHTTEECYPYSEEV